MNKKIIPLLFFAFSPHAFALDAVDLSSSISASFGRVKPNENISYTATITNNSATVAANAKILFYLPPRNVSIASLPSDCMTVGKNITCTVGNLTNGANATRTISVSFSKTGGANTSALALSDNDDATVSNNLSHVATTITNKVLPPPNVSSVTVSPSSIIQGNSLTFSTTLSENLHSGYNVKVDYGNGLFLLSGSGKNYSLSITPTVSAAYSIGIYDNFNVLKSNTQTGNFSVTAPNAAPTLGLISGDTTATTGTSYVAQLSANDDNLSFIFMDWGDGATESKNASSGATVSFSHSYSNANSFIWNATAYDSQNATSTPVSKSVSVSQPVVVTPAPVVVTPTAPVVTKTTGYTKISNSGAALSDSATLGSGSNEWACTKDNKTGLIWEVKTTDGGLRDMNKTYTNYTPDYPKCGWSGCETDFKGKYGDSSNTDGFVTAVNNQSLCGATDWRLPTNEELKGLVYCSDGKTTTLGKDTSGYICTGSPTKPTINVTYFPNTLSNWFWSSSPNAYYSSNAWIVDFYGGYSNFNVKYNFDGNVRLVRG